MAKIGENGRLVIPAKIRHALGLQAGDTVVMRVEDNEVRLSSLRQAVKRAQDLVRLHIPNDVSLVDELLVERRREAGRE